MTKTWLALGRPEGGRTLGMPPCCSQRYKRHHVLSTSCAFLQDPHVMCTSARCHRSCHLACQIDPTLWRLELERVSGRLGRATAGDARGVCAQFDAKKKGGGTNLEGRFTSVTR